MPFLYDSKATLISRGHNIQKAQILGNVTVHLINLFATLSVIRDNRSSAAVVAQEVHFITHVFGSLSQQSNAPRNPVYVLYLTAPTRDLENVSRFRLVHF